MLTNISKTKNSCFSLYNILGFSVESFSVNMLTNWYFIIIIFIFIFKAKRDFW